MVVFTCNHCGESIHKPAVEKHYNFACRKFKDLTCVDCLKDFRHEEYVVHTKCLTEDERYAAKGSMPIGVQRKGEAKQEAWVDMIRAIIQEDINMKLQNKNLLLTISKHNNVPRKKQKFVNYIKSATGGKVSENTISEVWDVIESYKEKHAKLNKTKEENGKKQESNLNSETSLIQSGENSTEKAPKTTKRKDLDDSTEAVSPKKKSKVATESENVDDSIEAASPKKKSKKEKSKAAKESENVKVDRNSLEASTPKKKKQNAIDDSNPTEQKTNGEVDNSMEAASPKKKSKKEKLKAAKESENVKVDRNSLEASTPKEKKQNAIDDSNPTEQKTNGDVDNSMEAASPKKKSKKEKLKAVKESENVEIDRNSSEAFRSNEKRNGKIDNSVEATSPKKKSKEAENVNVESNSSGTFASNKKRKQKGIEDSNEIEQKRNGTLETNHQFEENSTLKKNKKQNDTIEISLKENQENDLLKVDKKKKNKNNTSGVSIEADKSLSKINEQNDTTQLDESSLIENDQNNGKSFVIEEVILNILNKKNEISIEKLEKKVTTKYMNHTQETEVSQKFVKKFHKKLRKCEKVEISDKIVKLKNVLFDEQL